MSDNLGNSTLIQQLLDRLAAGDETARDELIERSHERLHRLARQMLRDNPRVRRWNETGDVLQNALIRLTRALKTERPESTRRFVGLAATQIRRELIDLARQIPRKKHATDPFQPRFDGPASPLHDPGRQDSDVDAFSTDDMQRFHIAVDDLPDELREVFENKFYLGLTQQEIASNLSTSTKTIKRRWRNARIVLQQALDDTAGV